MRDTEGMIALVLVGVLLMAAAAVWRRVAPSTALRGWSPFWVEMLGVGVIVAGLWRFPMARWIGLAAAVFLLLASGIRAFRGRGTSKGPSATG